MIAKNYKAFLSGRPCMYILRQINDITEGFIDGYFELLSMFIDGVKLPYHYCKSDLDSGYLDVYVNDEVYVRFIALSTKKNKLKRMTILKDWKYIFFDEYIVDPTTETYLADEVNKFTDGVYGTMYRYNTRGDGVIYMMSNPYSRSNIWHSYLKIPTEKLEPGCILFGPNYVIQCFEPSEELKEHIMKINNLITYDDEYKKYAWNGEFVCDENIQVVKQQPENFSLYYLFKLDGGYVAVYGGYNNTCNFSFWSKRVEAPPSNRRDVFCFDLNNMSKDYKTIMMMRDYKQGFARLKKAMATGSIAYEDFDASWLLQQIYSFI